MILECGQCSTVAGVGHADNGRENYYFYTDGGYYLTDKSESHMDLINFPVRHKRTVWVNTYLNGAVAAYETRGGADIMAVADRIKKSAVSNSTSTSRKGMEVVNFLRRTNRRYCGKEGWEEGRWRGEHLAAVIGFIMDDNALSLTCIIQPTASPASRLDLDFEEGEGL